MAKFVFHCLIIWNEFWIISVLGFNDFSFWSPSRCKPGSVCRAVHPGNSKLFLWEWAAVTGRLKSIIPGTVCMGGSSFFQSLFLLQFSLFSYMLEEGRIDICVSFHDGEVWGMETWLGFHRKIWVRNSGQIWIPVLSLSVPLGPDAITLNFKNVGLLYQNYFFSNISCFGRKIKGFKLCHRKDLNLLTIV